MGLLSVYDVAGPFVLVAHRHARHAGPVRDVRVFQLWSSGIMARRDRGQPLEALGIQSRIATPRSRCRSLGPRRSDRTGKGVAFMDERDGRRTIEEMEETSEGTDR